MQTELRALLTAMTAERDKLNAAILALRTMQTGGATSVAKPKAAKPKKAKPARKTFYTPETKALVVAEMQQRPDSINRTEFAKQVCRRHGVRPNTVLTSWQRWAKNGNGATVDTTLGAQPTV